MGPLAVEETSGDVMAPAAPPPPPPPPGLLSPCQPCGRTSKYKTQCHPSASRLHVREVGSGPCPWDERKNGPLASPEGPGALAQTSDASPGGQGQPPPGGLKGGSDAPVSRPDGEACDASPGKRPEARGARCSRGYARRGSYSRLRLHP